MGESTGIAWTDHTFNPWWGCERVSRACQHCYAEAFAKRTGHDIWGKTSERRFFGDKHWNEPLRWNAKAAAAEQTALVFCASMADVFEDRVELIEHRDRLWKLITATPALTWLLLTKRPQNVLSFVPSSWWSEQWPANVWIGTTVEDQQRADELLDVLCEIPAAGRFVSCEPLLEQVDLCLDHRSIWPIDWVICGGESGPGHRPLVLDHARSIRDQCDAAAVPFFFKQIGGRTPTAGGHELDGRTIQQFPADWY